MTERQKDRKTEWRTGWKQYTPLNYVCGGYKKLFFSRGLFISCCPAGSMISYRRHKILSAWKSHNHDNRITFISHCLIGLKSNKDNFFLSTILSFLVLRIYKPKCMTILLVLNTHPNLQQNLTKNCFFVWVEALRPSQQFFSHVAMESPLPGYYQYFLGGKFFGR